LSLTGQAHAAQALLFALPLSGLLGFMALSAYPVCRSQAWLGRRWGPVLARWAAASLLAGTVWWGAALAWNAVGRLGPAQLPLVQLAPAGWGLWLAAGCGLYLLSLLAHEVLVAFERVAQAAQAAAQSRVLARDAELQLLRTQIDPHFLFNSLNALSALTSLDAGAARDMAIDLAQFFRRTLAMAQRERISLADELDLCQHFLAIEQRRLGDKLRCDWQVDAQAKAALLPPLLLQPLLENALKHGIRQLAGGGKVQIEVVLRPPWLHLAVRNPVPAQPVAAAPDAGLGLGLRNVRARLRAQYGERARLQWHNEGPQFTVDITLPLDCGDSA
jgi:two-component system, LytTR family, sensor histidine kinase AlgZ